MKHYPSYFVSLMCFVGHYFTLEYCLTEKSMCAMSKGEMSCLTTRVLPQDLLIPAPLVTKYQELSNTPQYVFKKLNSIAITFQL